MDNECQNMLQETFKELIQIIPYKSTSNGENKIFLSKVGNVASLVEFLPSMNRALDFIPSTANEIR